MTEMGSRGSRRPSVWSDRGQRFETVRRNGNPHDWASRAVVSATATSTTATAWGSRYFGTRRAAAAEHAAASSEGFNTAVFPPSERREQEHEGLAPRADDQRYPQGFAPNADVAGLEHERRVDAFGLHPYASGCLSA
jgi:hypothetical protein